MLAVSQSGQALDLIRALIGIVSLPTEGKSTKTLSTTLLVAVGKSCRPGAS
jgi:hypothetical protein